MAQRAAGGAGRGGPELLVTLGRRSPRRPKVTRCPVGQPLQPQLQPAGQPHEEPCPHEQLRMAISR